MLMLGFLGHLTAVTVMSGLACYFGTCRTCCSCECFGRGQSHDDCDEAPSPVNDESVTPSTPTAPVVGHWQCTSIWSQGRMQDDDKELASWTYDFYEDGTAFAFLGDMGVMATCSSDEDGMTGSISYDPSLADLVADEDFEIDCTEDGGKPTLRVSLRGSDAARDFLVYEKVGNAPSEPDKNTLVDSVN